MSFWENTRIKITAFLKAALGLLFFICVDCLVYYIFAFFRVDSDIYTGTVNFTACVAVIVTMLIINKVCSSKEKKLIVAGKLSPVQVIFIIVVAFGMLGLVTMYIAVADKIAEYFDSLNEDMEAYRESVDRFSDTPQAVIPVWDSLLYVFNLCFIVPVAEELTFRGVIYGQLRRGFGPWFSVILSAVAFGIMHGINIHIGYALICGFIIAACYYLTDSLIASILIHMIFNIFGSGVATFMSIEYFGIPREFTSECMVLVNMISLLAMPLAVIAFAGLLSIKRKKVKEAKVAQEMVITETAQDNIEDGIVTESVQASCDDGNGAES